jgi:hypothetical protein
MLTNVLNPGRAGDSTSLLQRLAPAALPSSHLNPCPLAANCKSLAFLRAGYCAQQSTAKDRTAGSPEVQATSQTPAKHSGRLGLISGLCTCPPLQPPSRRCAIVCGPEEKIALEQFPQSELILHSWCHGSFAWKNREKPPYETWNFEFRRRTLAESISEPLS